MGDMAYRHLPFLFYIGEEGSFIIDLEGKDTVLIGNGERSHEEGGVGRCRGGLEGKAMEGRQHGKLEL